MREKLRNTFTCNFIYVCAMRAIRARACIYMYVNSIAYKNEISVKHTG